MGTQNSLQMKAWVIKGDILAVASGEGHDIDITKDQDLYHYAINQFFHLDVADLQNEKIEQLMNDLEEYYHNPSLYDEDIMVYPGAYKTKKSELDFQGNTGWLVLIKIIVDF